MKKLLTVLMAFALIFAFAACGGGDEASLDFGWYGTDVPSGFETNEYCMEFVDSADSDRKIKVSIDTDTFGDAAAARDAACEYEGNTVGDDVTLGDYTWKSLDFTWNGDRASAQYFLDLEGAVVQITMFCLTADEPEGQQFLENIRFAEGNVYEAEQAWMQEVNESK